MSAWPSVRARALLQALLSIGWRIKRQSGSHKTMAREGWRDYVFAFHDGDEVGPRMLARIAKCTGVTPQDLQDQLYVQVDRVGAISLNTPLLARGGSKGR